jgi:hypothetical protein
MKIIEEGQIDSPVSSLEDGQIGVITEWPGGLYNYKGTIVQRCYRHLFQVGGGHSWSELFSLDNYDSPAYQQGRVRILPKGTKLEI